MKLDKFVDPLPRLPIAKPLHRTNQTSYYEMRMAEVKQKMHRDLPETTVWGFENRYLGPTLEVKTGEKVSVKWINALPKKHLLPIDHTVHGAEADKPDVRTVTHLHGGRVEAASDGYPEAWFTQDYNETGPFFEKEIYEYANLQRSCTLWYHDHTIGITRLNVYAGLAGFYIIRNQHEESLNLPKDAFEIPLIIQDKTFNGNGTLFYPSQSNEPVPEIDPSVVPAFLGEVNMVNGMVWPYLEVEPRKYRFRILNGANSRFYRLSLDSNQYFYQIGTDGGLKEIPIGLKQLIISPAERIDIILDFTNLEGQTILLKNDAPYPYPNGDAIDPNTVGKIMEFRVKKPLSSIDTSVIPNYLGPIHWLKEKDVSNQRYLQLNEEKDKYGRPILLLNKTKWGAPITEDPILDSTEIWNLINVTGDSHPIHLHLIQFQILEHRPFDLAHFKKTGKIKYTGKPIPPLPQDRGWKDTVRTIPGMITRIIGHFSPYAGLYVWHCHILEHEDYEMMRPYMVLPRPRPN